MMGLNGTDVESPPLRSPQHGRPERWLSALVFLTLATSAVEGYLQQGDPGLGKALPALLVLSWAAHLVLSRRMPRMHVISWLAVLLLLVVVTSSAINADDPYVAVYSARWAPFLVLVVVLVDLLAREVSLRLAVAALATGAMAAALGGLYSFLVSGDLRATGPLDDPNDLAYVLVTAIPFVLYSSARRATRFSTVARHLGVLLLLVGMASTFSRGATTALLVALVWAAARGLVRLRLVASWSLLLIAASAVLWVVGSSTIKEAFAHKSFIAQSNIDSREIRWAAAANMLGQHPILGVGPGGVHQHYVAASNNAELADQAPAIHNMYLEVAAELGVIGLTIFAALIVTAVICTESMMRGPERRLALALQASLLLVCVSSTFLSEEYYMPLWAPIALAAAQQLRHERFLWRP